MTLTRRPATEEDFEFCRTVHHRAYEDVVTRQFGRWDLAEQDEFFARAWDTEAKELILADGALAGYCVIDDRGDDIHIRELVIDPAYQNGGVGTAVLRETIARGVPVVLGTFHANHARVLYERVGFKMFEETETHVLMRCDPS